MKIIVLVVGKNKKEYISEALGEYGKRINKYVPFDIKEISGIKGTGKYSEKEIREKEGENILKTLPADASIVLLDEKGKQMNSRGFAQWLQKVLNSGIRNLVFIIGGAYGFADQVYEKADMLLSLSRMTFSHQIARVVFAEQLYRAFTIIKGEPYHHGE
ncbi:MAG: 23S rRNA (pseudouridine(1915)-N(3))-methyltransferase RlmH [Bacteroidales bacterium]|nr:23S rRNA (pseudouridine(1915)-N(3))-methyltransferase RlmH [Bacteroidales bacterium]